jgi:adenylate cyclase
LKYTTVGDTVNIASRLESFGRERAEQMSGEFTCRILVGDSTVRYLGDQFLLERVGEVCLKGKEQKVGIFALSGRKVQDSLVREEATS